MAYKKSRGAQGASTGAQVGAMVGGPLGAGVGAAIGGLAGFIGGGSGPAKKGFSTSSAPRQLPDVTLPPYAMPSNSHEHDDSLNNMRMKAKYY